MRREFGNNNNNNEQIRGAHGAWGAGRGARGARDLIGSSFPTENEFSGGGKNMFSVKKIGKRTRRAFVVNNNNMKIP